MAPPSPARLYATLAGAVLVCLGLAGFFFDLSWLNFLYVASGALGLLLAGTTPRPYALCVGLIFVGVAIWGFADGEDWQQWPQPGAGAGGDRRLRRHAEAGARFETHQIGGKGTAETP